MYNPKPVDTSDISLPEELLALTERKRMRRRKLPRSLSHMTSCQKVKRSTTGTQHLKR